MRACLDTNVIVRYLTGEPAQQAEAARGLFEAAGRGDVALVVPAVVFVETGFVLLRVLGLDRSVAAGCLASLLECPGVAFDEYEVLWKTIELFRGHDVPLVDAYLAAYAIVRGGHGAVGGAAEGEAVVASFDRDFDRLPGVRRVSSSGGLGA